MKNFPDTDDFPINWDEETKSFLKGSPFLGMIEGKKEFLQTNYDFLIEKIPEIQLWSLQEFTSAMLLVGSRTFCVEINGTITNVMVPLSDMLNHKRPFDAMWAYDNEFQGFRMTAANDIKKDDEIFDSYG